MLQTAERFPEELDSIPASATKFLGSEAKVFMAYPYVCVSHFLGA